jgi:hypothetical protein
MHAAYTLGLHATSAERARAGEGREAECRALLARALPWLWAYGADETRDLEGEIQTMLSTPTPHAEHPTEPPTDARESVTDHAGLWDAAGRPRREEGDDA